MDLPKGRITSINTETREVKVDCNADGIFVFTIKEGDTEYWQSYMDCGTVITLPHCGINPVSKETLIACQQEKDQAHGQTKKRRSETEKTSGRSEG